MRVQIIAQDGPYSTAVGAQRILALAAYLSDKGDDVALITGAREPDTAILIRAGQISQWPTASESTAAPLGSTKSGAGTTGNRIGSRIPEPLKSRLAVVKSDVLDWPEHRSMRRWQRHATQLALDASAVKPHIVVSSLPSVTNHVAARAVARQLMVPWVPDYRDLWTNSQYYRRPRLRWEIDSRWEQRILADAAAVTAVSPEFVGSLRDLKPDLPGYTVMNGFDREPLDAVPLRDLGPGRHVVYAGIIYPGRRDPMPLLRAMATTPELFDVTLHLVGVDPHLVPPEAHTLGLDDRLRFIGRVDRKTALSYVKSADIALLLTWNDPGEAGVVSAKIFEYIGLAKPILALGYEGGRMAQILREYGYGQIANEPQQISAAMREMLAWSDAGLAADPTRVSAFDRRTQLARWRDVLVKYARTN